MNTCHLLCNKNDTTKHLQLQTYFTQTITRKFNNTSTIHCVNRQNAAIVWTKQQKEKELPPRCNLDICSSGIVQSVDLYLIPTFRDNLSVPSSRVKQSRTWHLGWLANRMSLKVGNYQSTLHYITDERILQNSRSQGHSDLPLETDTYVYHVRGLYRFTSCLRLLMCSEILSSKTTLRTVKISEVKKFLSLSNSMQESCSLDKISRSAHHKFPAIYCSHVYTSLDLIFSQFILTNTFI